MGLGELWWFPFSHTVALLAKAAALESDYTALREPPGAGGRGPGAGPGAGPHCPGRCNGTQLVSPWAVVLPMMGGHPGHCPSLLPLALLTPFFFPIPDRRLPAHLTTRRWELGSFGLTQSRRELRLWKQATSPPLGVWAAELGPSPCDDRLMLLFKVIHIY